MALPSIEDVLSSMLFLTFITIYKKNEQKGALIAIVTKDKSSTNKYNIATRNGIMKLLEMKKFST